MDNNDLRSYRILRKYKVISLVNGGLVLKDSGFKGVIRKIEQKKQRKKMMIDDSLKNISFEPNKLLIVIDKGIEDQSVIEQLKKEKQKFQFFKIDSKYEKGDITKITIYDLKNILFSGLLFLSQTKFIN